jgi:hypothetical protein
MKNTVVVVAAVLLGAFLAHAEGPKAAPKLSYKVIEASKGTTEAQKDFDELAAYGWRFVGALPNGMLAFEKSDK